MKKIFILLTLIPTICFGQWIQVGNDIDGVQTNEKSGTATRLNASGEIVIVGVPNNSTNGSASGQARIFEWSGTNWNQKGSLLTGDNGGDNLGQSVDISDSGTVVAMGAPGFLSSPAIAGYAKIYQWDGMDWVQRGSNITGSFADDSFGSDISLNAAGSIVAIGAERFFDTSYVRVFEWNGVAWNQLGDDIQGTAPEDGFGRAISLNASGTVIVIGVSNFDGSSNSNGMLRVYEWNGTNWIQKGTDLIGDNQLDNFGAGVTINDSGTIIAAGARATLNFSAGYVKIFEWNGTDWGQKGSTIGGNASDFFGDVNELNSAGDIIISGTILGEYAKILKFDGIDWIELDSLSGESPSDQFGISVSINNSGNRAAVGAFGNDAGGAQSGHVRIFENSTILSLENNNELNQFTFYPNPTDNYLHVRSQLDVLSYDLISLEGRTIKTNKSGIGKEFVVEFSELNSGLYCLILQTKDKRSIYKIMKK